MRRVRICYFNTWAAGLESAETYAARVSAIDLRPLVAAPAGPELLRKARLDCDWYGENTRCFAALRHEGLEFLPAWVCGPAGLLDLARVAREHAEERWLVTMGHQPQALGAAAGKVFALLARSGVRHLFYAFDEASRCMANFDAIAPHLSVLIHDETPLAESARALLSPACRTLHRSWVANVRPEEFPFCAEPERKIVFLGSQLGLTPHRLRQIEFLQEKFRDRFIASHDHSLAVAARGSLGRYQAAFCPEGRKFTTPAMSRTHTDRPFWSGCLGLVPISEDSRPGGRLEELHQAGLIVRYPHADLAALQEACERALEMPAAARRRIYDHFNRHETVGTVVADAIFEASAVPAR